MLINLFLTCQACVSHPVTYLFYPLWNHWVLNCQDILYFSNNLVETKVVVVGRHMLPNVPLALAHHLLSIKLWKKDPPPQLNKQLKRGQWSWVHSPVIWSLGCYWFELIGSRIYQLSALGLNFLTFKIRTLYQVMIGKITYLLYLTFAKCKGLQNMLYMHSLL